MNSILIFLILALAQLSVYFYLKNNITDLRFVNNLKATEVSKTIEPITKPSLKPTTQVTKRVITNDLDASKRMLLNKSLRHLEFISEFEMYLEDKNYKNFPIEFLQEFEKIKIEAQLSTLQNTHQLARDSKIAA